jgi:hypothetical protein
MQFWSSRGSKRFFYGWRGDFDVAAEFWQSLFISRSSRVINQKI